MGTYVANVHGLDGQNTTQITWNNGQNWTTIIDGVHGMNGQLMTQDSCVCYNLARAGNLRLI